MISEAAEILYNVKMSVLDGPLVFVDIETTGMSYSRNRVIEVAAIRVESGRITRSFNTLVDPQSELPPFITSLTGIKSDDLRQAPSFYDIADELHEILADAVFVAHNARFDYGFLKQEFKNTGRQFNPKLLCTVRLSRALYPAERSHKLQSLIDRCNLSADTRHRAYDDAHVMWQFLQHSQLHFPVEIIETAISQQIKAPSLPKGLSPALVKDLPETAGVYIFQDGKGLPLYIGKSVNIKKRVLSHFSADHAYESEFKISQQIANIETLVTGGELEALLLESKLIKDEQPLYNRQLRRQQKLTLTRQRIDEAGYLRLTIEDTDRIDPAQTGDILGVYTTKGKARDFLSQAVKDYGLCPRLMGLEKGQGACFSHQLKKCGGACAGQEAPAQYNSRLLSVFNGRRLQDWPYNSPIIIQEDFGGQALRSLVIDQWCVIAKVIQEPACEPQVSFQEKMFDIDTYKILRSYFAAKMHKLSVKPISLEQLHSLAA
jgi:DNA polymerase III subunit epsilon